MKKFKTKKAFTLVELVVTIAILSIVAGFGIGIFASTMRNYSAASVTAKEQEIALQVETFILDHARTAKDVTFIREHTVTGTAGFEKNAQEIMKNHEGAFITADKATPNKVKTFLGFDNGSGTVKADAALTYESIDHITFAIKRHKIDKDDPDLGSFVFLNYEIVMATGYSIKGEVVLNNCTSMTITPDTDKYIDNSISVRVCSNTEDTGIAFITK
ncbi:MAG: prepilin-type N-terminal cleavage/methylation domain-containing protein [Clostridia bacterium]|nr:prepilin-type N-terminal cleavage/methylation domain-containing protein [Clostridia bacterium]